MSLAGRASFALVTNNVVAEVTTPRSIRVRPSARIALYHIIVLSVIARCLQQMRQPTSLIAALPYSPSVPEDGR